MTGSFFGRLRGRRLPRPALRENEAPLRAELFSVDQLARHAASLAVLHQVAKGGGGDHLISRLDDNERVLIETYHLIAAAVARDRSISPAAEWLLDNFYLIEDQIRLARRNLPPSYSRELPRLSSAPDAGSPRAYVVALELIAHVDGRVDFDSLNGFIAAYKRPAHVAGRAVGDPDHDGPGVDRELAAGGGAGGRRSAGSRSGRRLGRAHVESGRAESDRSGLGAGRSGARQSAAVGRLPGGTDQASARTKSAPDFREQLVRTPTAAERA